MAPNMPPQRKPAPSEATVRILTVVLLYAVFAGLWILLSDKAMEWLLTSPAEIALASTLKGLVFVVVTSLLLWGLMRRLIGTADASLRTVVRGRRRFLPLGLLCAVIVGIGVAGIFHVVSQQRDMGIAQLQAVADLKAQQIENWLNERLDDARFVQTNQFWLSLYHRWRDAHDAASGELLRARMQNYRVNAAVGGIALLDGDGKLLWNSESGAFVADDKTVGAMWRQAIANRRLVSLGPYRDAKGRLHLDFFVPLPATADENGPIVVLHVDPVRLLFPLLNAWPVPGMRGETILLRRDGNQVLFLSNLEHRADAAANFRLPLADDSQLSARLLGHGGVSSHEVVTGIDYRGQPAIAVARAIRGSDWVLMAELEEAQLFQSAARDVLWIAITCLLVLFTTITGIVLYRQRQDLTVAQREHELQAEKLRALQLLDAISEGSGDAIFAKDAMGRYLMFNREAARASGRSVDEMIGRDDTQIFPAPQAAMIMENDRQVMQEKRTITFHETLSTVTGNVDYMATKGPLHDAEGHVTGVFGISRDISELKKMESALRESRERLHLALQAGRGGVWDWDLDNGEAWWSEEMYALWGVDTGMTLNRDNLLAPILEADRQRLLQTVGQAVAEQRGFRCEYRIRHPVSGERWMASSGQLVNDAAGRPTHLLGITIDITDRKHAEREIAEQEAYLRTLLQTTADGFLVVDAEGRLIDVNEAYCRMSGYARNELMDMSIGDLDAKETPTQTARHIEDIFQIGSGLFETRHRRKDGSIFDVEISVAVLESDMGPRQISFCRDISLRKEAEAETARLQKRIQQAQKMESIGNLAGGIAHDFNNILFPILGYSELLLDALSGDEKLRRQVREVIKAARRGSELVQQILAFSRQAEQKKLPVRIQQVLREVLKLMRAAIPADITINRDIQGDCPPVMADPTQLHQIVMNLITNAYHAVEATAGTISVGLRRDILSAQDVVDRSIASGRYAVLSIADTGHGIEPDVLDKIFEPYFTTKSQGKGTGLGLSVVYGIVRDHHGDIQVATRPGKGSCFTIYLPLLETAPEQPPVEAQQDPAAGREHILVVDDEAAVVRLETLTLERLGYRVTAFLDSLEAFEAFRRDPAAFDLVLTDMTMPAMTGDQLAGAIKEVRSDIPVILCTGFSERLDADHTRDMGIDRLLMKPVARADLARAVRAVLDETNGPA